MLAFVHIEKTAGTTFIHLLRKNYFLRYLDARPVVKHGKGILTARDMRILSRVNPFLTCIAGHSVQSHSDLQTWRNNIRFITILRNPVDRYISQFNYWNDKLGKNVSFHQFLANPDTWNFQTRKVAGVADVERAKVELTDRFFHVGVLERFDEFLEVLRRKLDPAFFETSYETKNVARSGGNSLSAIIDKHHDDVVKNNELDLHLYEYVINTLLPRDEAKYGEATQPREEFVEGKAHRRQFSWKLYVDYALRKLYYEPVTGILRRSNGLPYAGSYERN